MWTTFGPYLGLCLLITITPGLDTAVVIRSTLRGGTRAGLWTAVGCALGLFVHAVGVALGLAGLLLRSAVAFEVVKLAGAALLVLLGLRSLWAAWRAGRRAATDRDQRTATDEQAAPLESAPAPESAAAARARRLATRSPFAQGLLTNLTNPKATLFFLATLPQFVPTHGTGAAVPVALGLATIAVMFSLTGLSLVALLLGRVRRWLDSPRFRRIQDALLGLTLIGLGARVAVE